MRTVYMIRHGETTANRDGIATGQMDVSLTLRGRQQAEACRTFLRMTDLKFDTIVCSGLRRTRETADIINQDLARPIHQHPELNEQNFGDWEGQSWDVILPEIERHGHNAPYGETHQEFIARITTAFVKLLNQYEGSVLFVTHAGVFEALFSEYRYPKIKVANCALYRLLCSDDGAIEPL